MTGNLREKLQQFNHFVKLEYFNKVHAQPFVCNVKINYICKHSPTPTRILALCKHPYVVLEVTEKFRKLG